VTVKLGPQPRDVGRRWTSQESGIGSKRANSRVQTKELQPWDLKDMRFFRVEAYINFTVFVAFPALSRGTKA